MYLYKSIHHILYSFTIYNQLAGRRGFSETNDTKLLISFGKNNWSICSICHKDILLLISVSYFLLLLDCNKLSDSRCHLSRVHVWICNVFARIWLKPVEETTYNINKSECIMSGGMNVWINLVINVTFILVLCFISG